MNYQALQAQFEQACAELPNKNTREAADKYLIEFRSQPNVLPLCKHIYECTQRDDVRFQVVVAMKETVAREYGLHPRNEMQALRDWLWEYVVTNFERLMPYIKNSTLSTAAVLVKRGWLEESKEEKEAFFGKVTGLLNGDNKQRQVALLLFSYILDEFSSDRASAVGLPYDFHIKVRMSFEEGELRHIFQVLVQLLQHNLQNGIRMESQADMDLILTTVTGIEKVLGWTFVRPGDNALQGRLETKPHVADTSSAGNFPIGWKDFIIRPDVIDMFFLLHHSLQEHDRIPELTLQCLQHLVGIRGSVFHVNRNGIIVEDADAQRAFVGHILKGYLKMLSTFLATNVFDPDNDSITELVGVTAMAKRILQNFRLNIIATSPDFLPFLNELGKLTITCWSNSMGGLDDGIEAADELLDLWAGLVEQIEEFVAHQAALRTTGPANLEFDFQTLMTFVTGVTCHVFDSYVDAKLKFAEYSVDDEVDGLKDEYMFEDQLLAVAVIGRVNPAKSIGKLQNLVKDRYAQIHQILSGSGGENAYALMPILNEQVHWLALIGGHLLADSGRGETPEIPRTLRALSQHSGEGADPVVTLAMGLLKTLELVSVEADSPQFAHCSPQVAESLLWFLERWGETYLFMSDTNVGSSSLVRAFGPNEGGPGTLEFLLSMLRKTFVLWVGEPDVLMQIVHVFSAFSRMAPVRNALLVSPQFRDLISFFLDSLSRISPEVHSPLIENIATIATHASQPEVRAHYFAGLSSAIEKRFLDVVQDPRFHEVYQLPTTIENVISTLEMYGGLALAADEDNTREIFATISKYFDMFIKLLEVYRTVQEVEKYILMVFGNLIRCQSFEELSEADCQKLYSAVLALLKTYGQNEIGKKRVHSPDREEELYEDLACILEMLAQLMASQYEGLAWNDILAKRRIKANVDVADVVFYGLNIIIPLITDQMLLFPELCKDYISLVSNLVRYFPDKLSTLPPELIASLVRSLEFGMNNFMAEVARGAFEAVTTLSLFAWDEEAHPGASMDFLNPHLDRVLQKTLEMFLFKEFDSALMEAAGESLFGLILARGEHYTLLTQHLIARQPHPELAQRLSTALQSLNTAIAKTAQAPGAVDRLRTARIEGFIGGQGASWIAPYREHLEAFLLNVRGFLRVK
ncbi:armadillo-type protein [Phlyctochytrium arcticum]|nr:armadillo-type protein [Phlyctochytrium arcticum]